MNSLDIALLVLLLLAAFAGWKIKSLTLFGVGFSIALAPLLAGLAGPIAGAWLKGFGMAGAGAQTWGWWIVLGLAGAMIMGLFKILSKVFHGLMLGWLDRGFGSLMIVGALLAALLVCAPALDNNLTTYGSENSIFFHKIAPVFHGK